jgi:hypothetical protein
MARFPATSWLISAASCFKQEYPVSSTTTLHAPTSSVSTSTASTAFKSLGFLGSSRGQPTFPRSKSPRSYIIYFIAHILSSEVSSAAFASRAIHHAQKILSPKRILGFSARLKICRHVSHLLGTTPPLSRRISKRLVILSTRKGTPSSTEEWKSSLKLNLGRPLGCVVSHG